MVTKKVTETETKLKKMSLDEAKKLLEEKQTKGLERKEQYAKYHKVKAHATLLEELNKDKIIVFPSVDAPWYKIGGKSALFYAYDVAYRACGKKDLPAIRHDTDNTHRFRDGIVFIKDIDALVARLSKAGITNYEVLKDGIYIFYLGREYSDVEIKGFKETKYRAGNELNDMVAIKRVYPEMRGIMIKLIKAIFPKSKKMPGFYQNTVGVWLAMAVNKMNLAYFELANGRGEATEHFRDIVTSCNEILAHLTIIKENDAWSPIELVQVGGLAVDLKTVVKKILAKQDNGATGRN